MKEDGCNEMKEHPASFANAFTNSVLPHPGGPGTHVAQNINKHVRKAKETM
jgi:hypothetical protein